MGKKVLIAVSTFAQYGDEPLHLLKKSGLDFSINTSGKRLTKEQTLSMGRGVHGIVAGLEAYDKDILDELSDLRCISRVGIGMDNVDLEAARSKGIEIRNTPDVVVQPVAELTIGMMFDLLRHIGKYTALMKTKTWERLPAGNLLKNNKVGILGLGRIGRRVAELLNMLEADVYGSDLNPDEVWAKKHNVTVVPTNELFLNTNILSIHLSEAGKQPLKITERELKQMPRGSFIVNVSRGRYIDESALVCMLKNGHIAGAALDVYEEEPYRGPLCECDNVVLTPHVATLTKEARLQMEIEATKNLIDYLTLKL